MSKRKFDLTDESRSVTVTILLLAWPVLVEQIFTTLVSYADTAMVGSMGAVATASVTISNSPIFLLNGIIMALGVGITSLVARAVGQDKPDLVRKLMRHAILAILVIGIPITAILIALHRMIPLWMGAAPDVLELASQYNLIVGFGRFFLTTSMVLNSAFRGYGDTKTPLKLNTIMNFVNVFFNFLLIYPTRTVTLFGHSFTMWGAGLEVQGAAIATTIGMTVAGLMALWVAFFRKNEYRIDIHSDWKVDKQLTKQIFNISLPAMLERMCMSSAGIVTSRSIATLGTVSLAANSLQLTAESMSFMPAFAFQTAITTLVGQCLGAGKPDLAVKFVKKSILMGSLMMALTSVGLYVFSVPLISLFTPDAQVIELGAACIRIMAYIQIPQVIGWIYAGVLRGAGDTKFSFYITAGTQWLIRTLFMVIGIHVFHLNIVEVQVVICVEVVVRMFLMYLRYRTGIWKTVLDKAEEDE